MGRPRTLSDVFASIRAEYFPRWDRQRTWRAKSSASLYANGQCHPERQLIVLRPDVEWDSAYMRKLLIHEICHAVTSPAHGGPWQRRMMKAAECAESRGDRELSHLLQDEVAGYQTSTFGTPGDVYDRIKRCKQELPESTWPDILNCIAQDTRLSQHEFLRIYRRAKAVFEETGRDLEEEKAVRELILARRKARARDKA